MSQYDRLTGVKHLRVRGLKAVSFAAVMKAIGLNIMRAAAVMRARNRARATGAGQSGLCSIVLLLLVLFKERFGQFYKASAYTTEFLRVDRICGLGPQISAF